MSNAKSQQMQNSNSIYCEKTISSKTFNAGLVARVKASNNEKFSQIQVIADKQIP